ncbi:tetratricopeptide repeat protein [Hyalangium gracile]|uniref:hypothetical protein n=1 Tax=Hyalangium gracile TaxID=394092 RepID=UPI001CCC2FC0|nr:hypothetical protein [Hyalangium gracile]
MSMVSIQPTPPGPQDQEQAPFAPLPLEMDPSGFTERAPALLSLLPDQPLSLALARADAFAVHAALTARLSREPSGPHRDTLRALLDDRTLFVMAERPPRLRSFLGNGVQLVGFPPPEQQQSQFIATRAFCLFGIPFVPLGDHLVHRGRDGQLEILGRVAGSSRSRVSRWKGPLALGGLVLAVAGVAMMPFIVRDVQLVNGLSQAVEVRLDGRALTLQPGQIARGNVYSLGTSYRVEASWPGAQKPFEALSLEPSQHAVYNILGAASVRLAEPPRGSAPVVLEGRAHPLESDERLVWEGGWERTLTHYIHAERWSEAAELAKAVFLASPSELEAGRAAARILARRQPEAALVFAHELAQRFHDEPSIHLLAQDLFIALGKRSEAFKLYSALAEKAPGSVERALLAARVVPPEQQRDAHADVLRRFPESPEAMRAQGRLRLSDGYPQEALELFDRALVKAPESLADLELRVRAMLFLKQVPEASLEVRRFAEDPRHVTWDYTVLAGRLAHVAGPRGTQYVARDLIPSAIKDSPERMALLSLLTGEGNVTDQDMKAVKDPAAHDALALTRAVLKDMDKAVQRAIAASEKVLLRLDVETAAVLALELSRRGEAQAADRLFGSSLTLMGARDALDTYVREGTVKPDFPLLPPGLQAAAYLVRAREINYNRFVEQAYARWTDMLGGMARRALDAGSDDSAWLESTQTPAFTAPAPSHRLHIQVIQNTPSRRADAVSAPPAPGNRIPRPWPAP